MADQPQPESELTNPTPAELSARADMSSAAPASPQIPVSNGKMILIAEDDPFISRMYQIKLEGAGYRVVVKNNGRDAYESIKADRPNLAILDINMPELTGLEVLSALQNDSFDFSTMPVIVLTNSSELSDRNTAHSYGAEYLVKAELTPREVLDLITEKLKA